MAQGITTQTCQLWDIWAHTFNYEVLSSLKAVTFGYSFDKHGIYACVPQESVISTTHFPIYMNDLPTSILRFLVNIRADVWFMRSWQLISMPT